MIEHGTPEWAAARLGKLTASRMSDAMAKIKSGWGASRANYAAELVCERLTGLPTPRFVSAAMQWGIDMEQEAIDAYAWHADVDVIQAGYVDHPVIEMSGASPDGYVGDDGLVEFKCPLTAQHIETLLGKAIPGKYLQQVQWQLACTKRQWVDYVSYDPRMPPAMRLFVQRVTRVPEQIAALEEQAVVFLREVQAQVDALAQQYAGQLDAA